jgi:hypothetical protein
MRLRNRDDEDLASGHRTYHQPVRRAITLILVELRIAEEYVEGIVHRVPVVDEVGSVPQIDLEWVAEIEHREQDFDPSACLDHCGTLYHMELTVRMLAEAARTAEGKLYVYGGQWNRVYTPIVPSTQKLAVVLVVKANYTEALTMHDLVVELVDADGHPAGVRVEGKFSVGHPPGTKVGDPAVVQMPIDVPPFQIPAYGRYEWKISVDDKPLGDLPMEVVPLPAQMFSGPGEQVQDVG